jgi:hypothetical protein
MGSLVRLMGPVALAGVLNACEAISGLSAYTAGDCPQGCDASVDSSATNDGHAPSDARANTDTGVGLATDGAGAGVDADGSSAGCATGLIACDLGCLDPSSPSSCGGCGNTCVGNAPLCVSADAGRYVCTGSDAGGSDAGGDCGASGCPTSAVTKNSCTSGGCNAAGGACTASGQGCYCVRDNQCLSRKCVTVVGQNDVSCGAGCTGSGAADGFDCLLASPGIPTISPPAFGYVPSNFNPASYTAPLTATTIDCSTTYDSSAHSFTGWCAGQTPPNITSSVSQSGGPAVDVLAFSGLTINAGNTLTIASSGGGNAVILAVYGAAAIQGAIHADGNAGASGSSTSGASGAGGNFNCGAHAGQGSGDSNDDGGGGGGAIGSGGLGGAGVYGAAGAAGTMRANASLKPLYGGCPGGNSGSWACTTSGGGGGGAVQISAVGTLTVGGSITANGGAGGTSACSARQNLCGTTYPGGGGGGGSGGAVLLEGQSVTTTGAAITVNGGNGGNPQAGAGVGGAGGTSS